jgi:hypothetical protein
MVSEKRGLIDRPEFCGNSDEQQRQKLRRARSSIQPKKSTDHIPRSDFVVVKLCNQNSVPARLTEANIFAPPPKMILFCHVHEF